MVDVAQMADPKIEAAAQAIVAASKTLADAGVKGSERQRALLLCALDSTENMQQAADLLGVSWRTVARRVAALRRDPRPPPEVQATLARIDGRKPTQAAAAGEKGRAKRYAKSS